MTKIINTPCVGICSTVYGDDRCKGCRRTAIEVIQWNQFSEIQKKQVIIELGAVIEKVCSNYFSVKDEEQLIEYVTSNSIRFFSYQPALCWAYYALRAKSYKGLCWRDIGCICKYDQTCQETYTIIDDNILNFYN